MLLAVDVGNTNVVFALFEGKDVRASVGDLLSRASKDELTGEA